MYKKEEKDAIHKVLGEMKGMAKDSIKRLMFPDHESIQDGVAGVRETQTKPDLAKTDVLVTKVDAPSESDLTEEEKMKLREMYSKIA